MNTLVITSRVLEGSAQATFPSPPLSHVEHMMLVILNACHCGVHENVYTKEYRWARWDEAGQPQGLKFRSQIGKVVP